MAASAVTAARGRPLASNAASAARPSTSLQYRPTASSRSLARSVPLIILVFATVTSVADPASMPSGSTGAVHRAVTLVAPRCVGIFHGDEGDRHEDPGERRARSLRCGLGDLEDPLEEPRHGVRVGDRMTCAIAGRCLRGEALPDRAQRLFLQGELLCERLRTSHKSLGSLTGVTASGAR